MAADHPVSVFDPVLVVVDSESIAISDKVCSHSKSFRFFVFISHGDTAYAYEHFY